MKGRKSKRLHRDILLTLHAPRRRQFLHDVTSKVRSVISIDAPHKYADATVSNLSEQYITMQIYQRNGESISLMDNAARFTTVATPERILCRGPLFSLRKFRKMQYYDAKHQIWTAVIITATIKFIHNANYENFITSHGKPISSSRSMVPCRKRNN